MSRPRVAIYARHSTDKQNPSSSADQAAACNALVSRLGGELVGTFTDPELSGYRRDRPGLMQLLEEVRAGRVQLIVCESLDRIARDGEDISWIGKKLRYSQVKLHTAGEGEIDEIKLAVAGLLGSLFLSQLRHKTFRGMEAAVLAGRLAGGRAYGYQKVPGLDKPGVMEVVGEEAETVRWIFEEFAKGKSAIHIATDLNLRCVPGPRGGEWNASTIRGDPKKQVGILNNPLYRGKLVWGRREWRKDPDSDRRERRYRLRAEEEWIVVDVPELAIVTPAMASAVDLEIEKRRAPDKGDRGNLTRPKHLLSGLIKCGECHSNFTIASKDFYRCAGARERGTCSSKARVRLGPLEDGVLSALQTELLTADLAELFVSEFQREIARLSKEDGEAGHKEDERLKKIETELDSLSMNLLSGIVVGETIGRMISEREAERKQILARRGAAKGQKATVLPHPALLRRYEERIGRLREALNDGVIRDEAFATVRGLIDTVTIHEDCASGTVTAELAASATKLLQFAQNGKKPHRSGGEAGTVVVVAGTGFEPVTFRL